MKRLTFLFLVALMAMVSFSANAQNQETKTVIISNFTSRAVAVDMKLFYKMATDEAKGYSLVQSDAAGKMTGFITVVATVDAEENAPCIKIRIANGKDMTILSFFNGWAAEVTDKFIAAGYTVAESNDLVTISKGEAKLVLKKDDFKKAVLTVSQVAGWQEIK